MIPIIEEQTTYMKLLGQLYIKKKEEKKRNRRKQDKINNNNNNDNKTNSPRPAKKKGEPREENWRALLGLFRARPVNRPISPQRSLVLRRAHNRIQRSHSCNAGTLPGLWSTLSWNTVLSDYMTKDVFWKLFCLDKN